MFDISFDLETWLVICSAIGAGFVFYLTATALSDGLGGRRLRRRLNAVRDRAQGIPAPATTAERSLSRQRNATTIDRIARRWLPRRDILASRLARTGYAITVGQYALVMIRRGGRGGDRADCRHFDRPHPKPARRGADRNGASPQDRQPHGKTPRRCLHQALSGGYRSDGSGAAV